jgi:hypothetical protein
MAISFEAEPQWPPISLQTGWFNWPSRLVPLTQNNANGVTRSAIKKSLVKKEKRRRQTRLRYARR